MVEALCVYRLGEGTNRRGKIEHTKEEGGNQECEGPEAADRKG